MIFMITFLYIIFLSRIIFSHMLGLISMLIIISTVNMFSGPDITQNVLNSYSSPLLKYHFVSSHWFISWLDREIQEGYLRGIQGRYLGLGGDLKHIIWGVLFFFFKVFIYLFMRDRDIGRGRSRLPTGSPMRDSDPETPGSCPETKADVQPLSHLGIPDFRSSIREKEYRVVIAHFTICKL